MPRFDPFTSVDRVTSAAKQSTVPPTAIYLTASANPLATRMASLIPG